MRFKPDRLVEYSDEEIIREIRRMASLIGGPILTYFDFAKHSRVSRTTIRRRIGTWREALGRAGLGHLYSGPVVSEKMRRQLARTLTDGELIEELRQVARFRGSDAISMEDVERHSRISGEVLRSRFGSWPKALELAGLRSSNHLRSWYTDNEGFENLLTVWTHHGRAPTYRQMGQPPSVVGGKAYVSRFGTWTKRSPLSSSGSTETRTSPHPASP